MLTSDDKYWATLNREQIVDNAKLWSKKFTTKRLEVFIDWYCSLIVKIFEKLTEQEKQGEVTENTQSIEALTNRKQTALIARFMREYPKEEIPTWLW